MLQVVKPHSEVLQASFFTMALNEGGLQSTRIDVVFDTYREVSIKNVERGIRGPF